MKRKKPGALIIETWAVEVIDNVYFHAYTEIANINSLIYYLFLMRQCIKNDLLFGYN